MFVVSLEGQTRARRRLGLKGTSRGASGSAPVARGAWLHDCAALRQCAPSRRRVRGQTPRSRLCSEVEGVARCDKFSRGSQPASVSVEQRRERRTSEGRVFPVASRPRLLYQKPRLKSEVHESWD